MAKGNELSVRMRLIQAGVQELNLSGVQNFSVRRVAAACDVSCAAPYKHFKDKQSFIAHILKYVHGLWSERQKQVIARFPHSTREKILEICIEYVRFLVENPYFRSVLMLTDEEFDNEHSKLRSQLSERSRNLIARYCEEKHVPPATAKFKTYIIRSLIYGASLMFDNGEMEYTEENMRLVAHAIEREFDLL